MKEVMVTKLGKEDSARFKELERGDKEISALIAEGHSKKSVFWTELRLKYNLFPIGTHYIKGNAIYKQEL